MTHRNMALTLDIPKVSLVRNYLSTVGTMTGVTYLSHTYSNGIDSFRALDPGMKLTPEMPGCPQFDLAVPFPNQHWKHRPNLGRP